MDLSLSKFIVFPISSLEKDFPGELIINSKIVFSVLLILYSFLSLKIKFLFKSIFTVPNSINLFIFFDFVLFNIIFYEYIDYHGNILDEVYTLIDS